MLHVIIYGSVFYPFFLSVNSSNVITDSPDLTSEFFFNYTDLVSCQISKYPLVSYIWRIPKQLTDCWLPSDSSKIYTSWTKTKPWSQDFYLIEITHHFFSIAPNSAEIWCTPTPCLSHDKLTLTHYLLVIMLKMVTMGSLSLWPQSEVTET